MVRRRIAPEETEPTDLQVCVQDTLDAAIVLAASAEGLRRPEWLRKVLSRAAEGPHQGPAPRSRVRLRDGAGRLADDLGLMRQIERLWPERALPNSGRSKVLRVRITPELDLAIKEAARIEHQPHGDWIRNQLTRAAVWRLGRVKDRASHAV